MDACRPNCFFRPSAIELKLYRTFRADQAHNPTKLDHYPINIKGVMTIRVRVGPTGWTHAVPTVFFIPSAIELKLYRKFRADQAHNPTKLDHYPINIKGVMTIRVRVGPTGSSVVDACRPNCFFRPSAIELKLYRKFRADQAHNPTKLDHYPINIKGVMTIRVRVGPTGSSVVDACRPNCFFRPSAIELKLYRKFRADQAHNPTKLDHYPINIKGVMTIRVRVGPTPNCHNSLNIYRIVIQLGGIVRLVSAKLPVKFQLDC